MTTRRSRSTGIAFCALAAVLALAPASQAKTFGANLRQSANSGQTCQTKLLVADMFGNETPTSSGANTCTWYTISRAYNTSRGSTIVPSSHGLLTSARVKVGRKSGRMRIVLLRAVSERPPAGNDGFTYPGSTLSNQACCVEVRRTRVFRPRRHRITKKRLGWRLHSVSSFDPYSGLTTTSYYVLALTVLSPNTPVPMHDTGRTGLYAPASTGFFPAFKRHQERVDGWGQSGQSVLLQGRVRG